MRKIKLKEINEWGAFAITWSAGNDEFQRHLKISRIFSIRFKQHKGTHNSVTFFVFDKMFFILTYIPLLVTAWHSNIVKPLKLQRFQVLSMAEESSASIPSQPEKPTKKGFGKVVPKEPKEEQPKDIGTIAYEKQASRGVENLYLFESLSSFSRCQNTTSSFGQ